MLTELEKLKLKPGVSFRQAVSKSVRSFRRKAFIAEIEKKLEKYQTILDTRILVHLNSRSIQQRHDFQELDQNVRDLVIAMDKGRDTVAQLLANQGLAIREHIDRGLDSHALKISHERAQRHFRDSLSFSGMFSRQEDIAEEHQGTYQWIFQPPCDGESQKPDREPAVTGKGNDGEACDDRKRGQQWSNFVAWLEHGKEIYWLNGKPGSGKSTLMKFITSNIWENAASKEAMVKWAGGNEVVTASFYFWSLGSTGLQKNLQGLLRSLLYQIASQRQDLISILMEHLQRSAKELEPSRALSVYEWTERRLRSVLKHFLDHKPSSVNLCVFIDGLDEMVGDEEILIDILQLLNDTPHTKVCVSSRPEQIYRQGFSGSPQIRLQDLNHGDIEKTATESLSPALKACFPCDEEEICYLIEDVILKAEGVFLWLELVIKGIKRGARYNADSLLELRERLKITPSSIDGLYEQMLGRLDKIYLQEAGKYFRFLMAERTPFYMPPTLMEFVCAESVPWDHVRKGNTAWFESPEFSEMCQHVETRLLTRCAGLVEVEHQSPEVLKGDIESTPPYGILFHTLDLRPNQEKHNVCHQLREVKFIHKSAIDFLQTHKQALLQNRDDGSATDLSLLRGTTGVLGIVPVAISAKEFRISRNGQEIIAGQIGLTMHFLAAFAASIAFSKSTLDNVAVEMVDDVYQIIERVDTSINGPDHDWYGYYDGSRGGRLQLERTPFHEVHGFAAFLGCHDYVSYHRSLGTYSLEDNNYLLACTIHGVMCFSLDTSHLPVNCALIEDILCQGADPNLSLDVCENFLQCLYKYTISAWGACLYFHRRLARIEGPPLPNGPKLDPVLQCSKALMESFISRNADVNTSICHFIHFISGDSKKTSRSWMIGIEETPLSYLKRTMDSKEHHMISPLVNLLRQRGALERRRFQLITTDWDGRGCIYQVIYQVSEEESQRLCEVWPLHDRTSKEEDDSLLDAILDVEASLLKRDIMDEMTFELVSSLLNKTDIW